MTPAPDTDRTAEENELREALADTIGHALVEAGPGMAIGVGVFELVADRLLSGPLAPILQEAVHLRAENANLRDRVREAEGAGRDPDGSGSRPSDQAASHPAPAGFDPSRAPCPSGCIKPNACSRHRQCMYAQSPKQCRHLGKDLTPDIEAAEARYAR